MSINEWRPAFRGRIMRARLKHMRLQPYNVLRVDESNTIRRRALRLTVCASPGDVCHRVLIPVSDDPCETCIATRATFWPRLQASCIRDRQTDNDGDGKIGSSCRWRGGMVQGRQTFMPEICQCQLARTTLLSRMSFFHRYSISSRYSCAIQLEQPVSCDNDVDVSWTKVMEVVLNTASNPKSDHRFLSTLDQAQPSRGIHVKISVECWDLVLESLWMQVWWNVSFDSTTSSACWSGPSGPDVRTPLGECRPRTSDAREKQVAIYFMYL